MKFLMTLSILLLGCIFEENVDACGFQPPLPSDMLVQVIQMSDEPVPFFLQKNENIVAAVSNSGYIKFLNLESTQEIFSGHCLDGLEDDSSEEECDGKSEKKEEIKNFYGERKFPVCAVFHDLAAVPSESPFFPFKMVLRDGTMLRWDPESKTCTEIFKGGDDRYTSATQLHDSRVALASEEFYIKIIDPKDGKKASKIIGSHDREINTLVQYDEKLLASSSDDGTVKVWDIDVSECCYVFDEKSEDDIDSLIRLTDGRLAFGLAGRVVVWNPKTGAVIALKEQLGEITCLVQLSEKNLAAASTDGSINIQNVNHHQHWLTLIDSPGIRGLFRLQNGRFISSDLSGKITVWDINTGSEPNVWCTLV